MPAVPHFSANQFRAALLLLVVGLVMAETMNAQTLYWDRNSSTSGAGGTPAGTWINDNSAGNRNWTSSSGGSASTVRWTNGRDAVFSAGTDATGAYIVTVSGTVGVSSITIQEGTPTFSGGTINFSDATPDFLVGTGLSSTVDSVVSGTNGLTKTGAGVLIFDGSAKTYTGTTTVSAGTLQLNSSNLISDSSALSVASGATFALDWGINETVAALSGAGTVDFRSGTFTVGSAANTTFSGTLQNNYGTFVKQGSGDLTLSGTNTYSGATVINEGTVIAANDTALGTSSHGNVIANGAALHLQGGITLTEGQFSVSGTGVGGTGAIRNLSGSNTLNATLELSGNTTIAADAGSSLTASGQINLGAGNTLTTTGAGNLTLGGSITNSGAITKAGSGVLTLSGTGANSHSGATSVNSGTLVLAKTSGTNAIGGGAVNIGDGAGGAGSAVLRLDASHQIADYSGLITIAADGVLQMNNFTEGINTLAGTGLIDLSTSGYLAVGVNSGSSIFGGTITGAGTLEKAGSGTLAFTSNIDFAGTLKLSGGTLALGNISFSAGTLLVTGNSIIDFGGSASTLDLANLSIAAGVTLTIQNWANATDFFFTQNWSGASFSTSGVNPLNQVVFSGFSANDTKWQAYDNQITPVPEPSTYGAILLAGAGSVLAWRRRKRG